MLSRLSGLAHGEKSFFFTHNAIHLHAMVTACGYACETKSSYDWHGLKRGNATFALFQYTLAGRGCLTYDTTEYDVKPGSAMLLFFPHHNRYWLPKSSPFWEFIYLCLSGSDIMRIVKNIISTHGPLLTIDQSARSVLCAVSIVESALRGMVVSPFSASSGAYQLAMALCDDSTMHDKNHNRPTSILNAINYINSHLHDPLLSIDILAEVAGFSRYHFSRQFLQSVGMAPGEYVADVRIKEALRLLRETKLPVKEIAFKCGFVDPNYFCKAFRKKTGMAPGVLRKSGMY